MKTTYIKSPPKFVDKYINLVSNIELFDAFEKIITVINRLDINLITAIGNQPYLPNKWTIKETLQHIIDIERHLRSGIGWKHRISIEAICFNIVGHLIHHLQCIEINYYPLAKK